MLKRNVVATQASGRLGRYRARSFFSPSSGPPSPCRRVLPDPPAVAAIIFDVSKMMVQRKAFPDILRALRSVDRGAEGAEGFLTGGGDEAHAVRKRRAAFLRNCESKEAGAERCRKKEDSQPVREAGFFFVYGRGGAENGGASRHEAFPGEEGDAGGGVFSFLLLLYRLAEGSGKRIRFLMLENMRCLPEERRKTI